MTDCSQKKNGVLRHLFFFLMPVEMKRSSISGQDFSKLRNIHKTIRLDTTTKPVTEKTWFMAIRQPSPPKHTDQGPDAGKERTLLPEEQRPCMDQHPVDDTNQGIATTLTGRGRQ